MRPSGLLHFPYTIERGVRFPDEPIELIGFRKHVMETREPLMLTDSTPEVAERYGNPYVLAGEPVKSALFVPLVVGGRATGVISLQNVDRTHAFGEPTSSSSRRSPPASASRSRTRGSSTRRGGETRSSRSSTAFRRRSRASSIRRRSTTSSATSSRRSSTRRS